VLLINSVEMKEHDIEVEQGFYLTVAEMLDCTGHDYKKFPYSHKTRWNNRAAGDGRYEKHSIVRRYGPNHIHVALIRPRVSGVYASARLALDAIQKGLDATR